MCVWRRKNNPQSNETPTNKEEKALEIVSFQVGSFVPSDGEVPKRDEPRSCSRPVLQLRHFLRTESCSNVFELTGRARPRHFSPNEVTEQRGGCKKFSANDLPGYTRSHYLEGRRPTSCGILESDDARSTIVHPRTIR